MAVDICISPSFHIKIRILVHVFLALIAGISVNSSKRKVGGRAVPSLRVRIDRYYCCATENEKMNKL